MTTISVPLTADVEWRSVPGLEGRFEVSSDGQVRRACVAGQQRGRKPAGSLVRLYVRPTGYVMFRTSINLKRVNLSLHQMVAAAFIGPRPEGLEIAHLDGNPGNNRVENLAYVTRAENNAHKYAHGTILFGERSPTAKLSPADVQAIRSSSEGPYALADRFGVNPRHIWRIRKGIRWPHLMEAKS